MSRPQPESIIKRHIIQYLWMQPEFYGFVVKTTGVWDAAKNRYRANNGYGCRKGVSDIIGLWRGVGVAIEVKTASGRLTEDQKLFQKQFVAAGGLAVTLRSVSDAVAWVAALRTCGGIHSTDSCFES